MKVYNNILPASIFFVDLQVLSNKTSQQTGGSSDRHLLSPFGVNVSKIRYGTPQIRMVV